MLRGLRTTTLGALLVTATLSAVLCSHTSHAQSREELDRQARAEFNEGREAFSHGNYGDAAQRFEAAYQHSQRRELLYNIGTTYDRLHRWTQARDAFRGYLEAFPEAAERDEIRARLEVIDREIEREEELHRLQARGSSSNPPATRVIVRTVEPENHTIRNAGLVLGGLGVIGGIISGVVAYTTSISYNGLAMTCGQTPSGCPQASIDDIALRTTFINVFAVTGIVLFAAGVVMVVVDLVRPHPHELAAPITGRTTPRPTRARPAFTFGLAPTLGTGVGAIGVFAGVL